MDGMATQNQHPNSSADGIGKPPVQKPDNNSSNIGGNKVSEHTHQPNWASKLLVLVLIVVSVVIVMSFAPVAFRNASETVTLTKNDQFQAVFLNNGQVYFGKLSDIDDEYVLLEDIYYLQINQQVQPRQGSSGADNPEVSLVKLGDELHGPEDEMFIVRDKIVFWENLKPEGSQVSDAIKRHKNGETDDPAN
jgi:hypothetical protein